MMSNEEQKEVKEVVYYKASFWKRCFAIILDAIIAVFIGVAFFTLARDVINSTEHFKEIASELDQIKEDSSLYIYSNERDEFQDIVTYYQYTTDVSYAVKEREMNEHIDNFFVYLKDNISEDIAKEAWDYFDEYRLSIKPNSENKSYFISDNNEVKKPSEKPSSREYVENVYEPFLDNYCLGLFNTKITRVLEIQKEFSKAMLFVEIPFSVVLSATIVYYVIPLILKRGKQTIGRLAFKLGLVDSNVLMVSWKRFTIRFLIILFGEIILSCFTFGIPIIISFTMMVFTKKKQNFHDYMLDISEIELFENGIYKSKKEASEDQPSVHYEEINSK